MKKIDWDNQFLDMLLDEQVGGDTPPDVLARVQARVARQTPKAVVWPKRLLAAAAVMAVAGFLWLALKPGYPQPQSRGCVAADGVKRNSRLSAGPNGGRLQLGGYVNIDLAPGTALTLNGSDNNESIALEQGRVSCRVDQGRGGFSVMTELGSVWVVGTEFTVDLRQDGRMDVAVQSGMVLVTPRGETTGQLLKVGERKTLGRPPVLVPGTDLTPQEHRKLTSRETSITARLLTLQTQAWNSADVQEAMARAENAAQQLEDRVAANPRYNELRQTVKEMQKRLQTLEASDLHRSSKTYQEEVVTMQRDLRRIRGSLNALIAGDPKLADLKKQEEAAWLEFFNVYNRALAQDADYQKAVKELESVRGRLGHKDKPLPQIERPDPGLKE